MSGAEDDELPDADPIEPALGRIVRERKRRDIAVADSSRAAMDLRKRIDEDIQRERGE